MCSCDLSHNFNLTSLSSIVSVAISPSRDFSSTRLKYVTVKINEYYYYCSVKMKRILNLQKPGFLFSLLFTIFGFFCATVHLDNTSLWQPEGVKGKDETRRMRRTSHDRHMLPLQFLKRNLVISWNATGTLLCVEPWWENNRCTTLPSFPETGSRK